MIPHLDAITHTLANVPAGAWLAVLAMLALQRFARRLGLSFYAAFALPGTLAHELAHYSVALLLGARPQLPRLWPQRTPTGWRLGAVAFHATWWRAGPIALAPLLLLPGALAWVVVFLADARGARVAHAWITATLLGASLPSRADLRIAAPTLVVVVIAVALALAARLIA